jgi:hypothetical protein
MGHPLMIALDPDYAKNGLIRLSYSEGPLEDL